MVKYYYCKKCKNVVEEVNDKCVPACCGETMTLLNPNTVDAAKEKHVPQVSVQGKTVSVQVGSVIHPMTEEHFIQFITLETSKGVKRNMFKDSDNPVTVFTLEEDEKPVAVYAYCNLHGLWKS